MKLHPAITAIMKVLFLGAGSFSASSFKSFLKHSKLLKVPLEKVDILTNQKGKVLLKGVCNTNLDSELEICSKSFGNLQTFHCTARSLNFPFNWKDYNVGIVSSFSLFIPSRIINEIPLINIHPSLLPQWRGPAPIQYALLSGQERTGVSIIDLHPKIIDAGSILVQESFDIPNPDSIRYPELEDHFAELGGKLAATVLSNFDRYWSHKTEQSACNVSLSKKISKADGKISFKTDTYQTIDRKIRALSHQIPIKTLDFLPGKQVILEDILLDCPTTANSVYYDKLMKAVLFPVDGRSIGVKQFKIEGKSQIFTAGSFYSNYLKNKT